jgi:hypothetical protein
MAIDDGSFFWPPGGGSGSGVAIYSTFSAFPASAPLGTVAIASDTGNLYEFNGTSWVQIGGPGSALSLGALDSQAGTAQGAALVTGVLSMQSASATVPGLVNNTTQSFSGQKTFTTGITGTLTGAASLNVLTASLGNLTDSTAGADGIGITGGTGAVVGNVVIAQLQASASQNGFLASADWSTFNSKQAALGSINANVGTFALATVTATAQGLITAVSAASTTGSGNVVLATGPTLGLVNATGLPLTTGVTGILPVTNGGTGIGATWNANQIVLAGTSSSAAFGQVTGAAAGIPLVSAGATSKPFFSALNLAGGATVVTGVLPVTQGGTGSATMVNSYGVVTASSTPTGAMSAIAVGTSGNALISAGAGAFPAFGALSLAGAAVTGILPVPQGGTGAGTFTAYSLLAGGTTATGPHQSLASLGTSGNVLTSNGAGALPTWQVAGAGGFIQPTVQKFLTTGTTTGYLFTVTSANATVGATYTNNGNTYTVLGTISAGTQLFTSQPLAPTASGTLTKASGTGDATITFSANTPLGTYTTPANVAFIRIQMIAGGGGGGASGTGTGGASNGTAGGTTVFGSNLLVANGGAGTPGGSGAASGGAGGTASLGSGPIGIALTGGYGGGPQVESSAGEFLAGGGGGVSPFGGAGTSSYNANALPAIANTGSGGAGGTTSAVGGQYAAGGGGVGGYIDCILQNPGGGSTFPYCIGAAGAGGTGGTFNGSAGGSGVIIVTENYFNGAIGTATTVTGTITPAHGGTGPNGRYFSSVSTISGSLATVTYATLGFDSQSAYSSGVWTCQTAGKYLFNARIATAGTVALNSALDLQIQQTGSATQVSESVIDGAAGLTNLSTDVTDVFNCAVGDTIKVQVSSGATTPTIVASNTRNFLSWSYLGA